MGRTVEELSATLSPAEWVTWMAYYQLEPFGSPADDDRFRVLTTHVIAPHMRSGSELPFFFDRDPIERADDEVKFDLNTLAALERLAAKEN